MRSAIIISLLLGLVINLQSYRNKTKVQYNSSEPISTNESESNGDLLFENDTLAIYRIDSASFFQERMKYPIKNDTIPYISDLSKAKTMLAGRVTFGGWNDEKQIIDSVRDGGMIALIRFNNGKVIEANHSDNVLSEIGFIAYYPSEDLLLCEGGHSSDFSINLKDGKMDIEKLGNPSYIVHSVQKKYRLNGYFPGQECSEYFIQKQIGDDYRFYAPIPIHLSNEGFDLCNLKDIFWTSENELYFRNTYFDILEDPRLGFFKLLIKE